MKRWEMQGPGVFPADRPGGGIACRFLRRGTIES